MDWPTKLPYGKMKIDFITDTNFLVSADKGLSKIEGLDLILIEV